MLNKNLFEDYELLSKFFIGFDPYVKKMTEALSASAKMANSNWPPYNIKKFGENHYVIELAVAGCSKNDIDIEFDNGSLKISGSANITTEPDEPQWLYHGIAARSFTRTFTLADNIKVENAELINGVLKVWLEAFANKNEPTKIEIKEKNNGK